MTDTSLPTASDSGVALSIDFIPAETTADLHFFTQSGDEPCSGPLASVCVCMCVCLFFFYGACRAVHVVTGMWQACLSVIWNFVKLCEGVYMCVLELRSVVAGNIQGLNNTLPLPVCVCVCPHSM